jgi:hypothetical protein
VTNSLPRVDNLTDAWLGRPKMSLHTCGFKLKTGHGQSCRQEETDRTGGEVEEQVNAGHRSLVQPSRVWIHRSSG